MKTRTNDSSTWEYKPNSINIETVQGCNRRCTFCGTMGMEKKLHFVELPTVVHTVNLIKNANLKCRIRLAGHGEPLLHPEISKIISIIRLYLPKHPITLFTNATVIEKRPEIVDELFNAGLNNLLVDEYSDHRVGEFVRNNEICKKYHIVEQGAGTRMFEVTYKDKRICIVPPIDGDKNTINRKICNQCGAATPPLKQPVNKRCSVVFREITVRNDGNVAMCCNDFRGYYKVANILDYQELVDLWFHERFESARKYLIKGDRSFFPCNVCDVRPSRPGLLPDWNGKVKLEEPTDADREVVTRNSEPLAVIEKREWEL